MLSETGISHWSQTSGKVWGKEDLPVVKESWFRGRFKQTGHPQAHDQTWQQALMELADIIVRSLLIGFEQSLCLGDIPKS